MSIIKNLKHYNDILWLIYKYSRGSFLKELSSDANLPHVLKEKGREQGEAEDLVKTLEELGPFYIKLGQILSAESEFLPPEYEEALEKLQDKAQPMPYKDVEQVVVEELGNLPHQLFQTFEEEPISAASLGQVHFAILNNGKKVAVKIQRKDIYETILDQLEALENVCIFLEKNTTWGKKYQAIEKFESLRTTFLNELDYTKEAKNLKIIHENLKEFEHLIVPLPVDAFTTSRVLTMDYVTGEKLTDLTSIEKTDIINNKELCEELFKGFLKQILIDGFFQMDPHPGNVYLTSKNDVLSLVIFDMGMVSYIPSQLQGQFTRCLLAMSEGQELEVVKTLTTMGKKLPSFNEYFLRSKISALIGSYRELTISEIPIGKIVLKLARIAAEGGLWLPIQFSMIGKTFLSLNPVLKTLDPKFEPSEVLRNQASQLLGKRFYKQLNSQSFYIVLLEVLDFLQQLPSNLSEIFNQLVHNDYRLKIHFSESESITKNFEKIANRITMGLILASLIISAALLMRIETSFTLFGYPGFAMVLFLLAAMGSFLLILSILINDLKKK